LLEFLKLLILFFSLRFKFRF